MNGIPIERRVLEPRKINDDLIHYLRARHTFGPAIIITNNPRTFLSTFRKQWIREMTSLTKARASTLDIVKIGQLSRELLIMETLQFDASGSGGNSADIYILSPEQLDLIPTTCATIYLMPGPAFDPNYIAAALKDSQDLNIVDYSFHLAGKEKA